MDRIIAIALDLGTTSIKVGAMNEFHNFEILQVTSAPKLKHNKLSVTGDPYAYLDKVIQLLDQVKAYTPLDCPLSITSQRSSFVVWDSKTGEALSPIISWQDRDVPTENNIYNPVDFSQKTGLIFSPYYFGLKLSYWFYKNPGIKKDNIKSGTLDTWIIWKLSQGQHHITDDSMAARTGLYNIQQFNWDEHLLNFYTIPKSCLPKIVSSKSLNISLNKNFVIKSISADQSASLIGLDLRPGDININIGTGAFALRENAQGQKTPKNYQNALLYKDKNANFCSEGAIHGLTQTLQKFNIAWEDFKLTQNKNFCCPDSSGIGAPYWKSTSEFLSTHSSFQQLSMNEKQSCFIKGLAFRIQEIIDDLKNHQSKIILTGGRAQHPQLLRLLSHMNENLFISSHQESTCIGALKLGGYDIQKNEPSRIEFCDSPATKSEFLLWKSWLHKALKSL